MGHKVNPIGLRIGITKNWSSMWYANKKNYPKLLHQDLEINKIINKELANCGIGEIEIFRSANSATINIHTSRPGMIIGHQGKSVDQLKALLEKKFKDTFTITIKEIKKPDLNAKLVADNIAKQVVGRMPYRRASKSALNKVMDAGAIGGKILASGRLNGVEIARNEYFVQGKIPLHTLRADIDYAYVTALTTYGIIGIKVWIYKGEVFKKKGKEITLNPAEVKV